MTEPDENFEPALPSGAVAIVQDQGLLCLGVKGDDGVWRDKHGRVLEVERIVSVLSPRLPNK
jgi:hypothetical protein